MSPPPIVLSSFSREGALLKEAGAVDEEVGLVLLYLAVVLQLDPPLGRGLVPDGFADRGFQLHVLAEVVLGRRPLDVGQDLGLAYVEARPVRVALEGEDVGI